MPRSKAFPTAHALAPETSGERTEDRRLRTKSGRAQITRASEALLSHLLVTDLPARLSREIPKHTEF